MDDEGEVEVEKEQWQRQPIVPLQWLPIQEQEEHREKRIEIGEHDEMAPLLVSQILLMDRSGVNGEESRGTDVGGDEFTRRLYD